MKLSTVALVLGLAIGTSAQIYEVQSAPFHLVLESENKTINGQYLAACHTGAAIESLCLAGIPSPSKPGEINAPTFNFNTSESYLPTVEGNSPPGLITYQLRGSNFNISQPMNMQVWRATNVALLLFQPGTTGLEVNFDCEDRMNVEFGVDDSVDPIETSPKAYYRWYSCSTWYSGYRYVTLTWVLGNKEPQNPTCVKVNVKRVWA